MKAVNHSFSLKKGNVYALPIVHYNMEMAAQVRLAFSSIQPECLAVELAEPMQEQLFHAASRLPDISVVVTHDKNDDASYYMCEPCDAAFEGIRCAMENQLPCFCIDLDVFQYPERADRVPDPYAITRLGLQPYFAAYLNSQHPETELRLDEDWHREMYMAKRLKELSLQYESILFIGGMYHVENVLKLMDKDDFPPFEHAARKEVQVCTLTEESCREVMAEFGWITRRYEDLRSQFALEEENLLFEDMQLEDSSFPPDRQKLIYQLYKNASIPYKKNSGNEFHSYHLRNTMKFVRNYALATNRLMPDLFQLLSAAKGCVDHNFAYETWDLATQYPYLKNIDNLPALDLSLEDVWHSSKLIKFHLKENSRKTFRDVRRKKKSQESFKFRPPGPFAICSYQPEDLVVENFGEYLKKKGTQILTEDNSRTAPFTTSLEDGIDTKETIRNWHQKKLFVKIQGRPLGPTGSVVVVFDEDSPQEEEESHKEQFLWKTTWQGEHNQESDMAFYATEMRQNVVGPGISRCEYGGFVMSYPPRRMYDIWGDEDYFECKTKAEVLLMAAIDYAVEPVIVYVAAKPPRSQMKSFARRFGKKIIYIPIGQMSSVLLNKIRVFHVLDGHDKREIADEYIF